MKRSVGRDRKHLRRQVAHGPSATQSWFIERPGSYGRGCLLVGMFLSPIAWYWRAYTSLSTPKVTVLWFAGLGAVAWWIVWLMARGARPASFRIGWAAAAFVVAATVATAFSLSPRYSLVGGYTRCGGLIPLLLYVVTMFAVVGLYWEHPARLRWLVGSIGLSSGVGAVAVLLQQAGVDRVLWAGPVPGTALDYPVGLVGFSNFAGAHLGLGLPCLWYLARTCARARTRSALRALMAIVAVGLWYTQSRGGMVAALVGMGSMAFADRAGLDRKAKAVIAGAIVLVMTIGVLVVLHPAGDAAPSNLAGADVLRTKTLLFRVSYWESAAKIFLDHPIVGTGLDTFYAYYPAYRTVADGDTLGAVLTVDKPHNILLEHATDSGVLGMASYLTVVGLAVRYGIRRSRRLDGRERLLLATFVGVLAGYLAQGMVSIDQPSLAVLGWVAIGAIAAMADPCIVRARAALADQSAPNVGGELALPSRMKRSAAYTTVLMAVVGLSVVGIRPLRADVAMAAGHQAEAMRLDPFNGIYRLRAGGDALDAGPGSEDRTIKAETLTRVRSLFLDALRLLPRRIEVMTSLAHTETTWAIAVDPTHLAQADYWWHRALTGDPNNLYLRRSYDRDFQAAKDTVLSRLRTEAQVRPLDAGTRIALARTYLALRQDADARMALEDALRVDPGSNEASSLLARIK